MKDIALCVDKKCPARKTCKRFTTSSMKYQTYATFGRVNGADKCDGYIELFSEKDVKRCKSSKSSGGLLEKIDLYC